MHNFITIGRDCSPAAALRNMEMRPAALPFDWVVSSADLICKCITENFVGYHTDLTLNVHKTRLIDRRGFLFPHDYPASGIADISGQIGEGVFGEEAGRVILESWPEHYATVKAKYDRRIDRFQAILHDKTTPIIMLCRYTNEEALRIRAVLCTKYDRSDIYVVNSSGQVAETNTFVSVYTEKNGKWNDAAIWKQGVDKMIARLPTS
jgi:hypothetical protein